jgi:iron complex transport system substrate-binding protein
LQSIVCLSTTHAPLLAEINEVDKIVGFSDVQYSAVSQLQEQAKNGKTKEVGNTNGVINTELLLSLQANAMMTYSEKDYHKFTKLGQKVLINTEYLETLPLGRAEWILFAAAFFNKETAAQNFFDKVEKNYQEIKKLVATTTDKKPSVFGTIPYSNIWYMPAGESFAANLWLDAGCEYAWKDAKGTGSLQLSVEEVVQKAQNAAIWLNVGSINSIKELLATDNRFAVFEAVKNKQVYNSNKRITAGGGHEYYEYGVIRPDLVLQDLVIILHPKLLPNKELYFYKKLE